MTLSNDVLTGFLLLALGCSSGSEPIVTVSKRSQHLDENKTPVFQKIEELSDWRDRRKRITVLSAVGDAESIEVMSGCLLNDPVAEVREWILVVEQCDRKRVHPAMVDTILQLAEGKGKPCRHVLLTCFKIPEEGTELAPVLYYWLDWAQQQPNLKQETQQKIEKAMQLL